MRRLLRLPPRGITYEDAATVDLRIRITSAGEVDFNPEAPLDDKVAFLLRRNSDSQKEMNALAERLSALEAEGPSRMAELRAAMDEQVARELAVAREEYRIARIIGAIVLVLGLALATAATFVS